MSAAEITCPTCGHDLDLISPAIYTDRGGSDEFWVCRAEECGCDMSPSEVAQALLDETVPKSWDGLFQLLDEFYPLNVFPVRDDGPDRDPGPRIISLTRRLVADPTEAQIEAAAQAVRGEHAFIAAAAFGVPQEAAPECAELIARAALMAARDAR